MKKCAECGKNKEYKDFPKDSRLKIPYAARCKECKNRYNKQYLVTEEQKEAQRKRVRTRPKILRKFVIDYKIKNNICVDCKKSFDYWILQFDHLEGFEKKFEFHNIHTLGTLKKIKEEILKCEIVCANCHFDITYKRANRSYEHFKNY